MDVFISFPCVYIRNSLYLPPCLGLCHRCPPRQVLRTLRVRGQDYLVTSSGLVIYCTAPLWHICVFLIYGTSNSHIKGNKTLVLMQSGIVNEHQLMCDAHTLLEPHRTASLFYFTCYHPFSLFLLCVCHS